MWTKAGQRELPEGVPLLMAGRAPLTPSRFRDRLPSDWIRLVSAHEEFLAHALPVPSQPLRQILHRQTVDPRAALVLPHSPARGQHVRAFDHPFYQAARPRASSFLGSRRGFHAPSYPRGFTPALERKLQLPGHLWPCPFDLEDSRLFSRSALHHLAVATMASADFSLRR